ncbi:hypothetical protein SAMN04488125_102439 [Methylorubrum salsuginis]|uniref:Uncharacterized protein n=1 Tax=Methylorubrum salsuginis TaxID=414703 RepID=A0A1I4ALY1_9HYPH|nr:hypothetical protein SAMN04488125_102439 [Methylorubrum salsuginis]
MRQKQGCRAPVEHVESRAGARVDLEETPIVAVDQQVGAGEAGKTGRAHDPADGLDHGLPHGRGNRVRLVPAAGERAAVAERAQAGGHLPLLGQRQRFDAGAVAEEIQGKGAAGGFLLEVMAGGHRAGGTEADMRATAAARTLEEPRSSFRRCKTSRKRRFPSRPWGGGRRWGWCRMRLGGAFCTTPTPVPLHKGEGNPRPTRPMGDRRMRDREAFAQGGEARGVLQGGDRSRRRPKQGKAAGDLGHQGGRALEPAAEDHAERRASGLRSQGFEPREHRAPVPPPRTEAAGKRAVGFGQRQGVLIAEQVEDEGAQTRPARGLGQRPAGLGGDQERAALPHARRGQPAISTASV